MRTLQYTIILIFGFINNMNAQPKIGPPKEDTKLSACKEERRIFWVHGLGGDPLVTWQKAGSDIQEHFCVKNAFPVYTQTSLLAAGQNLLNNIKDYPPSKNPFIIAHSQGGLVARSACYQAVVVNRESFPITGIVTFGTPHEGAKILDHVDDIIQLIDEGCNELIEGPVTEFVESNFFLDLITNAKSVLKNIGKKSCEIAGAIAKHNYSDFQTSIAKDYRYSNPSEYFKQLKDFDCPLDKVAFYGVEDEPVCFRQMHWMINSCEEVDPFSANYDEDVLKSINKLSNTYYSKYYSYKGNAEFLWNEYRTCKYFPSCWPLLFWHYNQAYEAERKSQAYKHGYDWLNTLNNKWKVLIGAGEFVQVANCICRCEEYDASGNLINVTLHEEPSEEACKQNSIDWYISCSCEYTYDYYYADIEGSDGVVTNNSAQGFPGGFPKYVDVLLGSNHQQMRNDKNTGEKLYELLNGKKYGKHFNTPFKN